MNGAASPCRHVPTHKTLFLVVRDGNRTLHVQKLSYLPFPGQTLNLYEIGVPERGKISGVGVNPKGEPIHNIRVRAVHDTSNTGKFEDDHLTGKRVAKAAGFQARGLSGTTRIPRWVLERDRLLPFPSCRTDRRGRFQLLGVRAGRVTLFLQDRRHAEVITDNIVVANKSTDLGTLVVSPGHELSGRIVTKGPDQEYQPVAWALVSVLPVSWPRGMPAVRTNKRGEFVVHGLPADKATVYARRAYSRIWELARPVGDDYILGSRRNCTVQVVDPDGRPGGGCGFGPLLPRKQVHPPGSELLGTRQAGPGQPWHVRVATHPVWRRTAPSRQRAWFRTRRLQADQARVVPHLPVPGPKPPSPCPGRGGQATGRR